MGIVVDGAQKIPYAEEQKLRTTEGLQRTVDL
jgi:hypothetical protein